MSDYGYFGFADEMAFNRALDAYLTREDITSDDEGEPNFEAIEDGPSIEQLEGLFFSLGKGGGKTHF
jgi:hypothetical protein